jgi:endonuclease YncB( thermonuclease family)
VSRHWKPSKKTVVLEGTARPSRIRRDPVRLIDDKKVEAISEEREMIGGVAGIVLLAVALAVVVVAVSAFTVARYNAAEAARAARFGQCYNTGPNCVADGDTIYVQGEKVNIAGIEAPQIQGAKCEDERRRGIDAAVQLANMLNRGKVTLGAAARDASGRQVRKVEVDGADVGQAMIDAGVAREVGSDTPSWCG